ncbi:MAG: MYXO-CTERM sorting domain-containing protein [Planctomycetota bacterium]
MTATSTSTTCAASGSARGGPPASLSLLALGALAAIRRRP